MRSRRSLVAPLVAVMVCAGCGSVVAGSGRPAPGLKPRPLTGQTVTQVLLNGDALSKLLGQTFIAKSELPPRFGGAEKLQPALGVISPLNCAGVTTMLEESAYGSGPVENVARETWWNFLEPVRVISVAEGVVALPTAAEATALFEKFSQQWASCDGTVVTIERASIIVDRPKTTFSDTISDVRAGDSVLAATVMVDTQLAGSPPSGPRPEARAIGVRGNCLVEAEVAFFRTQSPSDQGSADVKTSAIDVAHAMMGKVSALS